MRQRVVVSLFFASYLLVGLSVFDDYGISWDEHTSRRNGAISAIYVNGKLHHPFLSENAIATKVEEDRGQKSVYSRSASDGIKLDYTEKTLLSYLDRDYGVFFELILIALEVVFDPRDSSGVYLMRHLFTFAFFYSGVLMFFWLTKKRFDSWIIGLIGCSFLLLSPIIFAHSFYNSKDLAFLSMFIIATSSLVNYLNNQSIRNALLHAFANAALIDIRVAGLVITAVTLFFVVADIIKAPSVQTRVKTILPGLVVYLWSLPCVVILFWPYLWENPIGNFLQAVSNMRKFRWESEVLYLGQFVEGTNLPWHYIPVWILVTTPPVYTACFIVGLYDGWKILKRNRLRLYGDDGERQDLAQLLFFFLPVVSVIVLRPLLLDGWRHLFFIYPAFLSIALKGVVAANGFLESSLVGSSRTVIRRASTIVLAFGLITTGYFMARYHPHQQVYFNTLAGKDVRKNFELDYWGLSYKQALEYVLKNDSSEVVKVNVANEPGELNAKILKPKDRERLRYVPLNEATYFLSNFRSHPQDYSFGSEFFAIRVGDAKIMAVYKLR